MAKRRLVLIHPSRLLPSFADCFGERVIGSRSAGSLNRLRSLPTVAIIVRDDGTPHWETSLYLAHVAMCSRSITGDTVRTYAESLLAWLDYVDAVVGDERIVSALDVCAYSAAMVNHQGGKSFAGATINARIGAVVRFYGWCQTNRLIDSELGRWASEQESFHREPLNRQSIAVNLAPCLDRRMPRFLTVDQLRRLFEITAMPFSLMFKWAVCTGMRRFEICALTIPTVGMLFRNSDANQALPSLETMRKGSRMHSIYVPQKLIRETRLYIEMERPTPANGYDDLVFLNNRGCAIQKKYLSERFRDAADMINSDATFHHLRHTYALTVLECLQARAESGSPINPLKTLQVLMGHAHLETTEIYLRALEINSVAVRETLDFLFGATA